MAEIDKTIGINKEKDRRKRSIDKKPTSSINHIKHPDAKKPNKPPSKKIKATTKTKKINRSAHISIVRSTNYSSNHLRSVRNIKMYP